MRAARALYKKSFKGHLLLNHLSKFKIISKNCSTWYLYQNCTNVSSPLNKRAIRALDKNIFQWHLLNHWSKIKIITQNCSSWCLLPKLHKWFHFTEQSGHQSPRKEMSLNCTCSWTTGPNSKQFHRIVPHDVLPQPKLHKWFHCTEQKGRQHYRYKIMSLNNISSAPLNKKASRALDEKNLWTTSPEPLVQIQNNFTELFLMMASTKIAQMVSLDQIKGLPEL